MNSKSILTGLLISLFLVGFALAEGGFYGTITYKECTCSTWDRVMIEPLYGGPPPDAYYVDTCEGTPRYHTYPTTYRTAFYKIWVELEQFSDCDRSAIEIIYHDASQGNQEVNLIVYGKESQPDGGGDE